MRKADAAHVETDKIIATIERELARQYGIAAEEMTAKYNKYMERFIANDVKKRQLVEAGKLTEAEWLEWRRRRFFDAKRFGGLCDELARDMERTNRAADALIQGHVPEVYAINYTHEARRIGKSIDAGTSWQMYDRKTVERLVKENPRTMPDYTPKGKKAAKRRAKDIRWNRRKFNTQLTQGILQGESWQDVTKRLKRVTDMNNASARRTARTALTSAQNGGRYDSYVDIEKKFNCKMEKTWLSSRDNHVRPSHRDVDGETVPINEEFSNRLMFPADPDGEPREVYNCRCTMAGNIMEMFEAEL